MRHKDRVPDDERYKIDPLTGCWMWRMALNSDGYAFISVLGRKMRSAHRYYYEKYKGEIPKGLDIDHLCRNRACVNPNHLEAVSRGENLNRGLKGQKWIDTFKTFYDVEKGGSAKWLVAPSTVEVFILGILKKAQETYYQIGSQETKIKINKLINE